MRKTITILIISASAESSGKGGKFYLWHVENVLLELHILKHLFKANRKTKRQQNEKNSKKNSKQMRKKNE